MSTKQLMEALSHFDPESLVMIESSDGEYGPVFVETVKPHAGKDEPMGVDYPPNEKLKGFPVLR